MARWDRALARLEDLVLAAGIGLATVLIALQVVLRYGFNRGLPWAEELSVYAVIWASFVAASAAIRGDSHLSVDIIAVILRGRALALAGRVANAVVAAFGLLLLVLGGQLVLRAAEFGQTSPALQVPMWAVYLVLPASGALIAVRAAARAWTPSRERA